MWDSKFKVILTFILSCEPSSKHAASSHFHYAVATFIKSWPFVLFVRPCKSAPASQNTLWSKKKKRKLNFNEANWWSAPLVWTTTKYGMPHQNALEIPLFKNAPGYG